MVEIDFSGAYMVPSKVYVGDRASLIFPLIGFPAGKEAVAGSVPLNSSPEIEIHHIAIERRPGGNFLTIELSAYSTGILELPPIAIAGETFYGLNVEISSILASDDSSTVLSAPALPLAIPGTSLLIYGSIGTAVLLILAASWALFWGRKRFQNWLAALRRRHLLAAMKGLERRLHRALLKGADCRKTLDVLSTEFRNFLAHFTGMRYQAMTAAEISRLDTPNGEFLGNFFKHCDIIRFSGYKIKDDEALAVLGDLKHFLAGIRV